MTNLLHDYPEIAALTPPAPVEQSPCSLCGGTGWRETMIDELGHGHGSWCFYCAGKGFIWTEVPND